MEALRKPLISPDNIELIWTCIGPIPLQVNVHPRINTLYKTGNDDTFIRRWKKSNTNTRGSVAQFPPPPQSSRSFTFMFGVGRRVGISFHVLDSRKKKKDTYPALAALDGPKVCSSVGPSGLSEACERHEVRRDVTDAKQDVKS